MEQEGEGIKRYFFLFVRGFFDNKYRHPMENIDDFDIILRFMLKTSFPAICALLIGGMFLILPLHSQEAEAPVSDAAVVGTRAFIPYTKEDNYQAMLAELLQAFDAERYGKALELVEAAELVFPDNPLFLNVHGAIYLKLRGWEKARAFFTQALEANPESFPARFNLGEAIFMEGDHEASLSYFENLNRMYRENELIEFKLVVLFCLTNRMEDAAYLAKRMRYPGNSAAWYFANAAVFLAKGERAQGWRYLDAASIIFASSNLAIYNETLAEAGYLK